MVQSAESSVHVRAAGRLSSRTTLNAVPGPLLVTVIVNEALSPAFTTPASGVFTTLRPGQLMVISPASFTGAALLASAVAIGLETLPHVAPVGAVTVTDPVPFGARLPKLQSRTPATIAH